MKTIGIIGAGIMAKGMVKNFLKNGYSVNVWNRTKSHVNDMLSNGATWQNSPKGVAATSDIVIECVSNDTASRNVWTNPQTGIIVGANNRTVCIASSTLSLTWIDELAQLCTKQNIPFLDMPLTGSRAGAEAGAMQLLVGGDSEVLDGIKLELGAISNHIFHFGPVGSGMRFKLMLNSLTGIQTAATAQAMTLAKKAGIKPQDFYNALIGASMSPASAATANVIKQYIAPTDSVSFTLKWLRKDFRYGHAMADTYDFTYDLLNTTEADLQQALDHNLGSEDITHIGKML